MDKNKKMGIRKTFLSEIVDLAKHQIFHSNEAINYLKSRRVNQNLIKKFEIGFLPSLNFNNESNFDKKLFTYWVRKNNNLKNRLIFPLTNPIGEILGLEIRSLDKKDYNIFMTREGKFTGCFFGIDKVIRNIFISKTVVVTEGIFDLLSISNFLPYGVCTLTSNISNSQINQLKRFSNNFIFLFDPNDDPGISGRNKMKKILSDKMVYNNFNFPYKDLNDFHVADKERFEKFVRKIPLEII